MGKLTGAVLILCGVCGLLWSWWRMQKKRQEAAGELIRMLARWEYSLERERLSLSEFLERFDSRDPQVSGWKNGLLASLAAREYPCGAMLWRRTLETHRRALGLGGELWELFCSADGAFFGTSSRESLRCARACRSRMEDCLRREREELSKKRRVYLPVGVLSAVVLIILLV